jgi:hypothetical protein
MYMAKPPAPVRKRKARRRYIFKTILEAQGSEVVKILD